jgi:DNA-binding MarR family transcriptional regulator
MHGIPSNPRRRARNPAGPPPGARGELPSPGVRPVLDGIRRLVRSLRLSTERARREAGISGAQLFVLQALAESEGQSVSELAERTATDQSSVSVVVTRLLRRRLLTRRADPRDRRRHLLNLTARGRAVARRTPPAAQQDLVRAIEALPRADQAALAELLGRIVSGMGEVSAELFFEATPAPRRIPRA